MATERIRSRTNRLVFSTLILLAILLIGSGSTTADAATFTFDFDSLSDGSGNSSVQTYMRTVIQAQTGVANGVTVTGAGVEKNYTGDNHVVGPVSGSTVTSMTLGNTDGGVQHATPWDAYLYNSDSIKIDMVFTIKIYSVQFDYEIFPNGNCSNYPGSCNPYPDFRFKADGLTYLYVQATDPGAGVGTYTHSPFSGPTYREQAPQFLGVSTTYYFPNGVTHLEFYDWPERIGIDNLTVSTPESSSILMLAAGLASLVAAHRRRS